MAARSRYSDEFRRQAVARVLDTGAPASKVAKEVGTSPETLRRWVRQQRDRTADAGWTGHVAAPAEGPDSAAEPARGNTQGNGTPQPGIAADSSRYPAPVHAAAASTDRGVPHPVQAPDDLFEAVARLPLRTRMLAVLFTWCCTVIASSLVSPPASVRAAATVVHVLSLVVAFGAVVLIDWHGLLWLLGRRGLHESTRLAAAADPLIWLGLAGLLASGALLRPDLSSPVAWTKLILVLALALNGALTSTTARLLRDLPRSVIPTSIPRHLQAKVLTATAVSQVGWWGAITIGFITAARRA